MVIGLTESESCQIVVLSLGPSEVPRVPLCYLMGFHPGREDGTQIPQTEGNI